MDAFERVDAGNVGRGHAFGRAVVADEEGGGGAEQGGERDRGGGGERRRKAKHTSAPIARDEGSERGIGAVAHPGGAEAGVDSVLETGIAHERRLLPGGEQPAKRVRMVGCFHAQCYVGERKIPWRILNAERLQG